MYFLEYDKSVQDKNEIIDNNGEGNLSSLLASPPPQSSKHASSQAPVSQFSKHPASQCPVPSPSPSITVLVDSVVGDRYYFCIKFTQKESISIFFISCFCFLKNHVFISACEWKSYFYSQLVKVCILQ